jgi:hypothetical protein
MRKIKEIAKKTQAETGLHSKIINFMKNTSPK